MMQFFLLAASTALASAVTFKLTSHVAAGSYEQFRRKHGHRQGSSDKISYEKRRELYHARIAHIASHNAQSSSWTAGVNKFADYTEEELKALMGYKRHARNSAYRSAEASSFLELQPSGELVSEHIANQVDWRPKLVSSKFVRDQGACGSCWAVAAVGALEMQSELRSHGHGNVTQLSHQQLVDCTPNPQHCGGTGGCQGATAELAFEYVKQHGLGALDSYQAPGLFRSSSGCSSGHPALSLQGWHRLPVNEVRPLMMAVANHGPVVVSVDGTTWMPYESGVFDGCSKDAIVNHAVLTVGYGTDLSADEGKQKYWLIRNSWGPDWGESGHIRMLRHKHSDDYCGVDNDPKQGVGCDGGPAELPVCGMCGVLSDSSHPVGASFN